MLRVVASAVELTATYLQFEELVDQFIPSGKNWKGWVKIAFQQPLVPVLPVAKELITKTKWGTPKPHHPTDHTKRKGTTKLFTFMSNGSRDGTPDATASERVDTPGLTSSSDVSTDNLTSEVNGDGVVREDDVNDRRKRPRTRVLSLFKRSRSKPRGSMDSEVSIAVSATYG